MLNKEQKEQERYNLDKVTVTYDYFYKEYTDVNAFNYLGSTNLDKIRKKIILLRNFINEKDEIISKIENDCKNHQNENKSILKENERLKELSGKLEKLKIRK